MKKLIFTLSLFLVLKTSYAAMPTIDIKGFGTAGMIKSDHPSYFLPEYGTSGRRVSFLPDSRLGLNVSSALSKEWSVAAQFIARADTQNDNTKLQWGFVSYRPLPEFAIRAGKLITPMWLYSQQINVGYSYLWVRPPVEVYSLLSGFTGINGVSLLSNFVNGSSTLSAELVAGGAETQVYTNNPNARALNEISVKDFVGLDISYSIEDIWTLHASYAQAKTNVKNESWYSSGNNLYSKVITPLSMASGRFFSLGSKLDFKNILFSGEFARRLLSGESLQSASAWYATVGYRLGRFTPYLSYSWLGGLRGSYYVHPETPTISTLKKEQNSRLLGINAQVHDSVILKAEVQATEYQYLDAAKNFKTNFINMSADFIF